MINKNTEFFLGFYGISSGSLSLSLLQMHKFHQSSPKCTQMYWCVPFLLYQALTPIVLPKNFMQ